LGPAVVFRGAGFRVNNWATQSLALSIQDVKVSSKLRWDVDIDQLNLHFHGALLEITGSGVLDAKGFKTTGLVDGLGGLIHGNTTIEFVWDPGYFSFAVSDSAIGGLVKTQSRWKVSSALDFLVGGGASISVPTTWLDKMERMPGAIRKALKKVLGSIGTGGQFRLSVTTDNTPANDFLAFWFTDVPVLSKVGLRLNFGGDTFADILRFMRNSDVDRLIAATPL
jgi:hypothetical protein